MRQAAKRKIRENQNMLARRFPKDSECYACFAVATDREHVPARAFFPRGMRQNLLTVPSCAEHNAKNFQDVEYVRNLIVCLEGLNVVGKRVFETARRSFDANDQSLFAKRERDAARG